MFEVSPHTLSHTKDIMNRKAIRNFSIIAHIDHGKSTLADRLIEATGTLSQREMSDRVLDDMDLERERGITIKAHVVRLEYKSLSGQEYILNLIDTPGHVDFNYEVSRSLAACEGVLLVIDASQGVEAQTLANTYLALDNDLTIIPVINKIDLAGAQTEHVKEQIEQVIGLDTEDTQFVSAKHGTGIQKLLETVVQKIPPPDGSYQKPLKALIFDSWFDLYRGVIVLVRVIDGVLKPGMKIQLISNGQTYEVEEVGIQSPKMKKVEKLSVGEVGFVIANIKTISDTPIGDTITSELNPTKVPFPGFKKVKPMVFSGLYPIDNKKYVLLRDALEKLSLNDSSFFYMPESSLALGFGFRCGFLGLLHMEIVQERLEREFNLSLITTAPGVRYRICQTDGRIIDIDNPNKMPPSTEIKSIKEPVISSTIITNHEYVGSILKLLEEKRGVQKGLKYLTPTRVSITYDLPLNEIVLDFYDRLKSASRGYASWDYHLSNYWTSPLVKLDILVGGETVDALSVIVHRDKAEMRGRSLVEKMKSLIPRQMFEVPLQAAIGNKVIARETVRALKKNVTAKCYGGDITRKRKLLERQKEGKKRMKRVGKVDIPQEAFLAVLKIG